jgi:hypothetical protein
MKRLIIGGLGGAASTLLLLWALGRLDLNPTAPLRGREAAEFRLAVRDAIEASRPMCAVSARAENDDIMRAARRELEAFRSKLADTAYAQQFDVAEADVLYTQSISQVECASPDATTAPEDLRRAAVEQTRKHVRLLMEKLPKQS